MLELYFLDKAKDREVVCAIYREVFDMPYKEIARRRKLEENEVISSICNFKRKFNNHDNMIEALQRFFYKE